MKKWEYATTTHSFKHLHWICLEIPFRQERSLCILSIFQIQESSQTQHRLKAPYKYKMGEVWKSWSQPLFDADHKTLPCRHCHSVSSHKQPHCTHCRPDSPMVGAYLHLQVMGLLYACFSFSAISVCTPRTLYTAFSRVHSTFTFTSDRLFHPWAEKTIIHNNMILAFMQCNKNFNIVLRFSVYIEIFIQEHASRWLLWFIRVVGKKKKSSFCTQENLVIAACFSTKLLLR